MIRQILIKELHSNLTNLRFIVGCLTCLALVLLITIVLAHDFKSALKTYSDAIASNENALSDIMAYQNLEVKIYKPPQLLGLFSQGVDKEVGGEVVVNYQSIPAEAKAYRSPNPLLAYFPHIDLILIFKVILTLLALMFTYNAISGEKESGTLSLMLANGISRSDILLGKYLAGAISFILPLLLSLLAALVFITTAGGLSISMEEGIRLLFLTIFSFLFLSIFLLLGLLLSSLTHRSFITLLLALFCWLFIVIIIPNSSPIVAAKIKNLPSRSTVDRQIQLVQDKYYHQFRDWYRRNPWPPGGTNFEWDNVVWLSSPHIMEYHLKTWEFVVPQELQEAQDIWRLEENYLNQVQGVIGLERLLSYFSPVGPYDELTDALANTDSHAYQEFLKSARLHREQILSFYRDKEAFHSYRWFSAYTKQTAPKTNEEVLRIRDEWRERWQERGMRLDAVRRMFEPINPAEIPRYFYQKESLSHIIRRCLGGIAYLVIVNLILFSLTFVCFSRYDVR